MCRTKSRWRCGLGNRAPPLPSTTTFGDSRNTIDAFGELIQRVVWGTHATVDAFNDVRHPEVSLDRVSYGSPLTIAGTVKHLTAVASERSVKLLNAILSRLLYHEEERQHRRLTNELLLRDIRRKEIENALEMLDLLREAQGDFSLDDIAALSQAVHTITGWGQSLHTASDR
jgi:hypothetical protein